MKEVKGKKDGSDIKFAKIDPSYIEGRPRLIFDGEDVVSLKRYPFIENYIPMPGDRVVVIKKVIIGKIV